MTPPASRPSAPSIHPTDAVRRVIELAAADRLSQSEHLQLLIALDAVGRAEYEQVIELCGARESSRLDMVNQIETLRQSLADLRASVELTRTRLPGEIPERLEHRLALLESYHHADEDDR